MEIMAKAILIAEDVEEDAVMVMDSLKKAGVKNPVLTVQDGDEVVAYLKGEGRFAERNKFPFPSVLLLDLKMPRMGGFQVMEWLRTQEIFKNLLIIVLTGCHELREVQKAYSLGAHSFLIKPCNPDDIKNLVRWFAAHWEGEGAAPPRRWR
jgi:CheY-like chemotaxis protein